MGNRGCYFPKLQTQKLSEQKRLAQRARRIDPKRPAPVSTRIRGSASTAAAHNHLKRFDACTRDVNRNFRGAMDLSAPSPDETGGPSRQPRSEGAVL